MHTCGPESDAGGNPGWWLATPLLLGDHTAVIVVRGLIPYDAWPATSASSASASTRWRST